MGKGLKLMGIGILVALLMISVPSIGVAATYCVGTAVELQDALDDAAGNGQDDLIMIQQDTYYGNFVYTSMEAFGVSIEGGYISDCLARVVEATNTVLDAQNNGRV
jgi:deoxyinosine 3'endonuclease (endonuclease V)